ncbi:MULTISPECIES: cytochrome P450 [unclassified Streptomyces]|uniref:cytochrome P450 n=1 Tax=unclassified Streptomyces TaxID=2593676 RepID=UPI002DDACCA6|nr:MULTISPECIES: cytochrome P450 [unclassified Streptomyces]WSA91106.1 cytochrome P450 [Streptomyces sp. NBC_01795]WSB75431.1 cytochrome P450 [Streptomyces sp. NBC_01775]WSS17843.1 cytochrome P450 [Streptomyces sp. NBC_01186]WSS45104.1 cytochrome P450 [Streptomyces sp. NBC_01187]
MGPRFRNDQRSRVYRELRAEHGPLAPVTLPGEVPAWLVLGYRELHQVTTDPALFSRDSGLWNQWPNIPADWPLLPMVGKQDSILYTVGERHQRRKSLTSDALAAVDPFELRTHSERFADELIDTMCGRGTADLIAEYAMEMPALVLARLCGFSDEEGRALVPSINALVDGGEDAVAGRENVMTAMRTLMSSRRAAPAAGVASRMLHHDFTEDFSFEELVEDMLVIFVAAHQPTADWIGNSLRLMLTDDRFAASLTGGRHSVPEAMNEVLWEDTPSQNIAGRWATRDTRLGGQRVAAGDLLILSFAAANSDPEVRPDQEAFTGGNSAFLSFGHGNHRCPYPGQDIAEGVARTSIEVLLDRLPDVELAVSPEALVWRPSPWLRGLASLPVRFTPTPTSGPGGNR